MTHIGLTAPLPSWDYSSHALWRPRRQTQSFDDVLKLSLQDTSLLITSTQGVNALQTKGIMFAENLASLIDGYCQLAGGRSVMAAGRGEPPSPNGTFRGAAALPHMPTSSSSPSLRNVGMPQPDCYGRIEREDAEGERSPTCSV